MGIKLTFCGRRRTQVDLRKVSLYNIQLKFSEDAELAHGVCVKKPE